MGVTYPNPGVHLEYFRLRKHSIIVDFITEPEFRFVFPFTRFLFFSVCSSFHAFLFFISVETELLHLQNYSFRTTFHSDSYFNMPLSIVLDSSQRKSAREAAITRINKDLELMIISISYDGSTRFGQNICCGILNSDSTQHAFYTMKINIADANPFGPPIITIAEVNGLARRHMRSLGIDIDETYDMFLVTNRKCNIAKESAASPTPPLNGRQS